MTPDEIAEIQEWLLILEARDLELPEFHAMQLKVAKATHVMLDRIAALEAVRDEWCAEARLLAGKLIERDAECTAERERREAAEAALRQVFVVSVDKTDKLQGHPVDKSPDLQVPNDDMVICPNCVHQFRAIPVNVQHEIAAERERRKAAEAALGEVVDCNNSDPILISREPGYRWYDVIARATAHFARYKD